MTDFAGHALVRELGQGSVALQAPGVGRGILDADGLGVGGGARGVEGCVGLGMVRFFPNGILLALLFGLVADLALARTDVSRGLGIGGDGQRENEDDKSDDQFILHGNPPNEHNHYTMQIGILVNFGRSRVRPI